MTVSQSGNSNNKDAVAALAGQFVHETQMRKVSLLKTPLFTGWLHLLFAGLMNLYLELRSNIEVALWKYIHITVFRLKNEVISYMLAHFGKIQFLQWEGLMRIGFTGKSSRV